MTLIKTLIGNKPSVALQAMVDGLREQSKRSDFVVDMGTFGRADSKVCFGCAATCTIQKLFGVNIPSTHIRFTTRRVEFINCVSGYITESVDLNDFEFAIDAVRLGCLTSLFQYCDIAGGLAPKVHWDLGEDNWEQTLPEVEKTIAELQRMGY